MSVIALYLLCKFIFLIYRGLQFLSNRIRGWAATEARVIRENAWT